jgi:hypothetical protein
VLLNTNFPDGVHTSAAGAGALAAAVAPNVRAISQQGSTMRPATYLMNVHDGLIGWCRIAGSVSDTIFLCRWWLVWVNGGRWVLGSRRPPMWHVWPYSTPAL